MAQSKKELEEWYSSPDPWGFNTNRDDLVRKTRILSALPQLDYERVLDIGCGNGFVTNDLPGKEIIGIDISENALRWAREHAPQHIQYICASLFDLPDLDLPPMDLIVINGVLYPQYIDAGQRLVYIIIDGLLKPGGILVCSHIYEWYQSRFPYLTVKREYFPYREFSQILEVYSK